jgi:hypothetical protein
MAVCSKAASDPDPTRPRLKHGQGQIRTCIGCRQRAAAAELLRVVVGPGSTVIPDPRHRAAGRGAWVHLDRNCVDLAERRRAFARALRAPGGLDPAAVREYVANSLGNPTGGTPQE